MTVMGQWSQYWSEDTLILIKDYTVETLLRKVACVRRSGGRRRAWLAAWRGLA